MKTAITATIIGVALALTATAAPLTKRCADLIPAMQKAYAAHPIPAAALAAQIHQESACRTTARSPVGARGLAQFMPTTWRDVAARHKITCDWRKAKCSLEAQAAYMRDLWRSKPGNRMPDECDRWGATAASYNGGAGWQRRNARRAAKLGGDPTRYFGDTGIEKYQHPKRAKWAVKENTEYPHRILKRQTAWTQAGLASVCN